MNNTIMIKKCLVVMITLLVMTPNAYAHKNKKHVHKHSHKVEKFHKPVVKPKAVNELNYGRLYSWCKDQAHPKVNDTDLQRIVDHVLVKKDPLLLISMIDTESEFRKNAISKKHAIGLMQVRPSVWLSELRKEFPHIRNYNDLLNINNNIDAGEYILAKYIEQTGSLKKALYCYSGGSSRYVNKVLRTYYTVSVASYLAQPIYQQYLATINVIGKLLI